MKRLIIFPMVFLCLDSNLNASQRHHVQPTTNTTDQNPIPEILLNRLNIIESQLAAQETRVTKLELHHQLSQHQVVPVILRDSRPDESLNDEPLPNEVLADETLNDNQEEDESCCSLACLLQLSPFCVILSTFSITGEYTSALAAGLWTYVLTKETNGLMAPVNKEHME